MRAAIYSPYLDTLGGGERYVISFAKVLVDEGYQTEIEWKDEGIRSKIEERFGVNLKKIKFVKNVKRGDGYDICFWVSDGSIPLLRARKNFLHFQVPFTGVKGRSLLNRMKLFRVNKVICNSYFTKSFIDQEFGVDSIVIYPPVDVKMFLPKRKENLILYVGRFSQLEQAKNQHILLDVFKKMVSRGLKGWKLVLAGGTEVGGSEYVTKLKKSVGKYPVEIVEKPKLKELKNLYGRAKIFWSAVGFGVNEKKEPKKVEHFGISLVEAMSAGCVPIVYLAGGYREIIEEGESGFFWSKVYDLIKKTSRLIKDSNLLRTMSKKVRERALVYEPERFYAEVSEII